MRRRIFITSGTMLALVGVVFMYLLIVAPRRNLDQFLKQVAKVEIGKTKLENWKKQVDRAHIANLFLKCDGEVCSIGWHGENTFLRRLRLAPRTLISANVSFKEGVASEIYVVIDVPYGDVESFDDIVVVVRQSMDNASACDPHYHVLRKYGEQTGVGMGPCVSPQDRARALAINTLCLSRIGGCKTVESILPEVFARPSM
jgi:hypothetical protein